MAIRLSLVTGGVPRTDHLIQPVRATVHEAPHQQGPRSPVGLRLHKLSVWNSCVYSTMMYGMTTCGLSGDQVKELQRAIMKHVRAIVNNQAHLTGDAHETIIDNP